MNEKMHKKYIRKNITDNLRGAPNHITLGTDIESDPFPFTEENKISKEQFHFEDLDHLDHL